MDSKLDNLAKNMANQMKVMEELRHENTMLKTLMVEMFEKNLYYYLDGIHAKIR
jgi:hypothetical protein